MTTFTYECNKTGKTWSYEIESLPAASVAYAINKGLREYHDNYHANITRKAFGARPDFAKMVNDSVDESVARIMAGDVPGAKVSVAAKVAAAVKSMTPEQLAALRAEIDAQLAA